MRRFSAVLACGFSLALLIASPASAQWFGKKTTKQPPQNPVAGNQGFAGYIRRLTIDAQAAAARGDLAQARTLAERAHKIAMTGKPMLVNEPDCSPEATAALVQRFKAIPDPAASTASAPAPGPKPDLNLNALLDQPATGTEMPLPPSPAPEVHGPASRPVAAKLSPTARQEIPASQTSNRITSVSKATRRQAKRQSPPQSSGFLALQTDWLSPDADSEELIEELAEQPARPVARRTAARSAQSLDASVAKPARTFRQKPPVEEENTDQTAEEDEEPEVTTAIGRGGNRWQLDVEHQASDVSDESVPQLSQDVSHQEDPIESDPTETALGIWSPAASSSEAGTSGQNVVSMSDFFDPSGNRLASHPLDEAPRMIETDFRQQPAAISPETTQTNAVAGNSQRRKDGPAVKVQDGPALEWLESPASAGASAKSVAKTLDAGMNWSEWTPARKAATMGLALLVAGVALFGLSFRWT